MDHEFRYSAAHRQLMAKYYKGYLGACDHPGHPGKKPYYAEKPILPTIGGTTSRLSNPHNTYNTIQTMCTIYTMYIVTHLHNVHCNILYNLSKSTRATVFFNYFWYNPVNMVYIPTTHICSKGFAELLNSFYQGC